MANKNEVKFEVAIIDKPIKDSLSTIEQSAKKLGKALEDSFNPNEIIQYEKECSPLETGLQTIQTAAQKLLPDLNSVKDNVKQYGDIAKKAFNLDDIVEYAKECSPFRQGLNEIKVEAENVAPRLDIIGDGAKKIGSALKKSFSVEKLVNFTKECISLGSGLQEAQFAVDTVFPSMKEDVNGFAKDAASSFGLSETVAKNYVGSLGKLAKSYGFSDKAAYDMSTTLAGLSADMASFYNIEPGEALTKLQSVFNGQTESLKDLGITMSDAELNQFAFAKGIGKTVEQMTDQEKVMLRYQYVQDQLKDATGDYASKQGLWSNQSKTFTLTMENLKATLGTGFINLFTPILKVVNELLSGLGWVADGFVSFTNLLTSIDISPAIDMFKELIGFITKPFTDNKEGISTAVSNIVSPIATTLNNIKNAISDVFGYLGQAYEEKIGPALSRISEAFSGVFQTILSVYNEYFAPVLENVMVRISDLFENYIKPIGENIINVISNIMTVISILWETVLQPIISMLANVIGAVLAPIFEAVYTSILNFIESILSFIKGLWDSWNAFTEFIANVVVTIKKIWDEVAVWLSDFIEGIKSAFSTVGEWFGNLFTNMITGVKNVFSNVAEFFGTVVTAIKQPFITIADWFRNIFSGAWEAVKNVFSSGGTVFNGIKEGIVSALSSVINGLIRGINIVIAKPLEWLNGALNMLRDISIAGFTPFDELWGENPIPVPQIPLLAQGGYVKRNTPQLAIIGDNSKYGEIVAPENKLQELLNRAVTNGDSAKTNALLELIASKLDTSGQYTFTAQLDGRELFRETIQQDQIYRRQTGRSAFQY